MEIVRDYANNPMLSASYVLELVLAAVLVLSAGGHLENLPP